MKTLIVAIIVGILATTASAFASTTFNDRMFNIVSEPTSIVQVTDQRGTQHSYELFTIKQASSTCVLSIDNAYGAQALSCK